MCGEAWAELAYNNGKYERPGKTFPTTYQGCASKPRERDDAAIIITL